MKKIGITLITFLILIGWNTQSRAHYQMSANDAEVIGQLIAGCATVLSNVKVRVEVAPTPVYKPVDMTSPYQNPDWVQWYQSLNRDQRDQLVREFKEASHYNDKLEWIDFVKSKMEGR